MIAAQFYKDSSSLEDVRFVIAISESTHSHSGPKHSTPTVIASFSKKTMGISLSPEALAKTIVDAINKEYNRAY